MRTNYLVMTRRPYEADAKGIETAEDFNDLFQDKRESWRADFSKTRGRHRRYKKRVANDLIMMDNKMTNDKNVEKQKPLKDLI